jgi:hypothetical protein
MQGFVTGTGRYFSRVHLISAGCVVWAVNTAAFACTSSVPAAAAAWAVNGVGLALVPPSIITRPYVAHSIAEHLATHALRVCCPRVSSGHLARLSCVLLLTMTRCNTYLSFCINSSRDLKRKLDNLCVFLSITHRLRMPTLSSRGSSNPGPERCSWHCTAP